MPRVGKYWLSLDLYYAPFDRAHTWAKIEQGNLVRVGVDDFAQKQAGELVYVSLLPVGKEVPQGKPFGSVEAGKWVGRKLSPVSGQIVRVNEQVLEAPELVNKDPYGEGWLVVIAPSNLDEELTRLVKGEQAVEWLKKEIKEITKEDVL